MSPTQLPLIFICSLSLFCHVSALPPAEAAHAQPEQLAAKVVALWRTPASLPPELRAPIEALDALTTDDIRGLLASDDPHARGVGLYLADRRCLPELLGEHPHFYDDDRATVPTAFPDSFGRVQLRETTVAEQFRDAWRVWFVAKVKSSDEIRQLQADGELDPWKGYRAWNVIIRRSQGLSPERVARIRQDIATLPDDLRWVVACAALGSEQGRTIFSEVEVRSLVLSIDASTKDAILADRAPLPKDLVAEFGNSADTLLHECAKAILRGEALPDPGARAAELRERIKAMNAARERQE